MSRLRNVCIVTDGTCCQTSVLCDNFGLEKGRDGHAANYNYYIACTTYYVIVVLSHTHVHVHVHMRVMHIRQRIIVSMAF